MALLQSCCCWHSLRKGSYASAIYTMLYFAVMIFIISIFVHEERMYLAAGNNTEDLQSSILEPETITAVTMGFNIVVLACCVMGLVCCTLLVYGIYRDKSHLLVPWILAVIVASLVDIAHIIFHISLEMNNFNPMTAILFTLDFFLIGFNLYALMCVISQYQEYRAGRGTAEQSRFCAVRYQTHAEGPGTGRARTRGLSLIPTPPGPSSAASPSGPSPQPPGGADLTTNWMCLLTPNSGHPAAASASSTTDQDSACVVTSRSPGGRKHVQFGNGQDRDRDDYCLKPEPGGRRRSAILRASLPDDSSSETAKSASVNPAGEDQRIAVSSNPSPTSTWTRSPGTTATTRTYLTSAGS